MSTPQPFDLLAPLPQGTTLLEASAGTGKTYTIAALATRYIAEGRTTIDRMLMVTFGRSATRELRERVREALTRARDALRDSASETTDAVVAHLAAQPPDHRRLAAERLARAVADFDAGTIATTHQFCLHALSGLGISADTDPGDVFVESIADLIDEVVDDFYVRKYGTGTPDGERLPYSEARRLAREAVNDPQAALDAGPVAPGSLEATRVAFAHAVREEVLRRRRTRRLTTFDDLVGRLRDALTDTVSGDVACARLRDTYEVVLVDEFQDTDPAQWTILRTAFHGHRTLVLIGDPKQAIYAFRGADVFSYLQAADVAGHHATLQTNWRSDAAVVQGIEAVIGGMQLGDPRIEVRPSAAHHAVSRLQVPGTARVRLRTVPSDSSSPPAVGEQRQVVAADVAADIAALLSSEACLHDRRVLPGDIAVLVGTHAQGSLVHEALRRAGVPAVVNTTASVFATDAARQWARLLRAMQRPRRAEVRAAALTEFLGRTPRELAFDGDHVDAEVALQLRRWAQTLEMASVAEMVAEIEQETHIAARVLSRPDGERALTDLRHVAGALHSHQRAARTGLAGLYDWLAAQIRRTHESSNEPTKELTRRLESDADAVQILTVHVSKGLEFPIVYVPYAWDRFPPKPDTTLRCHDSGGRRVLDVRGKDAIDREPLLEARDREEAGESLRLLYVAMTRASSQLVLHWAPSPRNTASAPLHRVLSARRDGCTDPQHAYPVSAVPALESPWVTTEQVGAAPWRRWEQPVAEIPALQVAPFTRHVDLTWRRTSYSGLTAAVHEAEFRPPGFREDEPDDTAAEQPVAEVGVSPFAGQPAGAAFGTLVHGVLEAVDTATGDLPAEIRQRCQEQLATFPVPDVEAESLTQALLPAMHTPLSDLAEQTTLAAVAPGDRLAEVGFELPLAAGGPGQTLAGLAGLLRRHLPLDDPLAAYPDRLDAPGLAEAALVGYLSGSIDAVLRIGRTPRFLVVDYKTNLLRDPAHPGAEALLSGYRPERLAAAMMDAHYPLQALLYSAALHRYLRWRLSEYDPATHLGGILYLFLRGMAGPTTPDGCGVFAWRPPAQLVVELSDLLDGRQS